MKINRTALKIVLLIFLVLVVLTTFLVTKDTPVVHTDEYTSNVSIEDGIQVIEVVANYQGYSPKEIQAKSGMDTILRVLSKDLYSCANSLRIPDLNITEILPSKGITDISLGKPKEGENIFGSCSMGMYTFEITFN